MKKKFFRVEVVINYSITDVICMSEQAGRDVIIGDDIYDNTDW